MTLFNVGSRLSYLILPRPRLFIIFLLCCFAFNIRAAEISLWLMAGEYTGNKIPTDQEINIFNLMYPHVSIDIDRDQITSQNVLLANEQLLKTVDEFKRSFATASMPDSENEALQVKVKLIGWHNDPLGKILNHAQAAGADIIQIGSTWTAFLADKNIIQDISHVIKPIEHNYISTAVQNCKVDGKKGYYSIPWSMDIRTWFYSKPLFDSAGMNVQDIKSLSDLGAQCELFKQHYQGENKWFIGVPTSVDDYSSLHVAMSWVWGWGGGIINKHGHSSLLQDNVLEGMTQYARLAKEKCIPLVKRDGNNLHLVDIEKDFLQGRYAMIFIGPWLLDAMPSEITHTLVNHGSIPGADGASPNVFMGGSHLAMVNSKRSDFEQGAAIALLKHLSERGQKKVGLPPQKNKLITMSRDPLRAKFPEVLLKQESRSYPRIAAWGAVEEILLSHIANIFQRVAEKGLLSETALRAIVFKEFSLADKKIENIINPPNYLLRISRVVFIILILLVAALAKYRIATKLSRGKAIRRLRSIKEKLHTAKTWKGRLEDCKPEIVRKDLVIKLQFVQHEIHFFKHKWGKDAREIIEFVTSIKLTIVKYQDIIVQQADNNNAYESHIIQYFEDEIRPILNNMAVLIDKYYISSYRLTELIRQLQESYPFSSVYENEISAGMLINVEDLRTCLENLLANSLTATADLEHPDIKLRISSSASYVNFCVVDNGPGMPKRSINSFSGQGLKDIKNIMHRWGGILTIKQSTAKEKQFVHLKIKKL